MCKACKKMDQFGLQCIDSEFALIARSALEAIFHFPAVLDAAGVASAAEQDALVAMIFNVLGIARVSERMEMIEERAILADGAITKTYFFPSTKSRIAIAKNSRDSFFILDFSFDGPESSRQTMNDLNCWLRNL